MIVNVPTFEVPTDPSAEYEQESRSFEALAELARKAQAAAHSLDAGTIHALLTEARLLAEERASSLRYKAGLIRQGVGL